MTILVVSDFTLFWLESSSQRDVDSIELSLLRRAPRAATVSAVNRASPTLPKLKVAALDAPAFTRLLGPLREIMERRAGESY